MHTKLKRGLPAVAVVICSLASFGEVQTVKVSDNYRTFFNTNLVFSAETAKTDAWLEDVGQPLFWFDCSDTTGWTVNSKDEVQKIPNKGTSERWLFFNQEKTLVNNYEQGLWYRKQWKILPPYLRIGENGLKGPYLDFGETGSLRVMFFDPVEIDGKQSHELRGIGTVIGVYRSYTGGGQVLGGKDFRRAAENSSYTLQPAEAGTSFANGLFFCNTKYPLAMGYDSRVWVGQQQHAPEQSFWSGNWEVVATRPAAANLTSHGLCGVPESSDYPGSRSSGGMGVAELLVFDKVLTDAQISKIVACLERKWLGRGTRGYDGEASLSWMEVAGPCESEYPTEGTETAVDVAAGETLTIGRLNGGRATTRPKLVKTGAGTLKLGDAANYGGEVTVRGGVLELGGKRTVPTFADLPKNGLMLHIDPSDAETVTIEDGTVVAVASKADTTDFNRGPYSVRQGDAAHRPTLAESVPSAGLAMLDFGTECGSRYLRVYDGETESQLRCASTVIAVVDERTAFGSSAFNDLFSSAAQFSKDQQWTASSVTHLLFTNTKIYLNDRMEMLPASAYGCAWVNGLPVDKTCETFEAPGFNVLAMRNMGYNYFKFLGGKAEDAAGGLRIGEVLVWQRGLSEREILDVQAYLAKKWLNRVNPGYADPSGAGVAEVQYVTGGAGGRIHVAEGETATVAHLAGEGVFEKTGGGTLRVGSFDGTSTSLLVKEGSVVAAEGADVASNCEIAADPALHLDPSDPGLVTTYLDGKEYLWRLEDPRGQIASGANLVYWNWSSTPWLNRDADALCNGHEVLDFGSFGQFNANAPRVSLSKSLLNVRAVYYVLGSQAGGGNALGNANASSDQVDYQVSTGNRSDFMRGNLAGYIIRETPLFANASENVKNGVLYVDGVETNLNTFVPNGGYQLIELHTTGGCQLSAFGTCLDFCGRGGFRLGEVVAFERELTERERTATRNYLLKKWRGKTEDELAPLPAKPALAVPARTLEKLVVDFANPSGESYPGEIIGVRAGMEVELRNLPDPLPLNAEVVVLTAAGVEGQANFRSVVPAAGSLPEGYKIRLSARDGVLKARIVGVGFTLLLR